MYQLGQSQTTGVERTTERRGGPNEWSRLIASTDSKFAPLLLGLREKTINNEVFGRGWDWLHQLIMFFISDIFRSIRWFIFIDQRSSDNDQSRFTVSEVDMIDMLSRDDEIFAD